MLCLILLSQVSTLFHIISFASLFIWKPSITYVLHTCYLNFCGSPLTPLLYRIRVSFPEKKFFYQFSYSKDYLKFYAICIETPVACFNYP